MTKNHEKKEHQRLTTGGVKKIAAGIALTGTLLGGMNLLNNSSNPVREVPRTESLAPSNFGVTGPVITTEVGKDKIYKGLEIAFLNELAKFKFDSGGHLRGEAVVIDGTDGDPSNDLRIEGLQDGDAAYLSRPVINPDEGHDPNGTWLAAYADGKAGFINEAAARQAEALETVISYPGEDVATNLEFGTVEEVHKNGILVQQYDEDGRPVGDLVAVGVMKIGDENLKP